MRHPFATEPHRQRAVSMVAVIIVFINRRHSIHDDVDKKSKYYLFSTLFALLIRSIDGCYFTFSVASSSFFGCCVLLCISCLSFDLGFLVTVCNVDFVCVRMLFFHFFRLFIQFDIVVVLVLSMIQVSRIYERQ